MIYQATIDAAEICARKGVTKAIISPGSRNAPLTLAFARHPKIETRVIPDERSAAFIALGMAKTSDEPVILVCTSGSSVYNYAPAVAEAFFSNVPLIVFSADRPPEWIDQLDGQTIRQQAIFGQHVKGNFQFPDSVVHPDQLWHAHRITNEAINLASSGNRGPVHINVPLREPFYPGDDTYSFSPSIKVFDRHPTEVKLPEGTVQQLKSSLDKGSKVLLIAGQDALDDATLKGISAFAARLDIPVITDVISNATSVTNAILHHDLFLGQLDDSTKEALAPDILLTIGRSVISKNLKLLLRRFQPTEHWHIGESEPTADTFQSLTGIIPVSTSVGLNQIDTITKSSKYLDKWRSLDESTKSVLHEVGDEWWEFPAVIQLIEGLPKNTCLHLANSMPVRWANFINHQRADLEVFANRGTSGIDGCLSTAVGCALTTNRPVFVILGDMSFLYDRNGLWHNYLPNNLRVVILNNHGGGIFRLIDGPSAQPELETFFETEQRLTSENTLRDFDIVYHQVETQADYTESLRSLFSADGAQAIELITDSKANKASFVALKKTLKRSSHLMKRRDFIRYTSGSLAAGSVLSPSASSFANFNLKQSTDVAVIGAGVMGSWTAFYLNQMGANVTLIDAYGPGNTRSSSGGETRILRADYGDKTIYTKMVIRAHELWEQYQKDWNRTLMYSTGRLNIGPESYRSYVESAVTRLTNFGIESELLEKSEINSRWPQIGIRDGEVALFNPGGAGGSTLLAREACRVTTEKFMAAGGTYVHAKALPGPIKGNQMESLKLSNGTSLNADQYIFAGGPWMGSLFPGILKERLKVFRRDVLFIGTPAGDPRFSYPNLPIWSFGGTRWYGFPDFHGRGLKAAPFPDYNSIDMDSDERLIHPIEIKRARDFVEERFPGLKSQPITEGRVCQLTFSSDEHFIVDRHPERDNVWFACAGSGHAFKHGPALGEYLSKRVLTNEGVPEYDTAFRLK